MKYIEKWQKEFDAILRIKKRNRRINRLCRLSNQINEVAVWWDDATQETAFAEARAIQTQCNDLLKGTNL